MSTRRTARWFFPALLILFLLVCVSLMLGRYGVAFSDVVRILFGGRGPSVAAERVVLQIRLPRVVMALLAGAALSVSGAAYQGVFQNPMASPDILGASHGAALGAAVAILLGFPFWGTALSAFFGGIVIVLLVSFIARRLRVQRTTGLILCGIMVGSVASAGVSLVKLVADPNNQLPAITYWLMGSLSATSWMTVKTALVPLLLGVVPLLLLRWKIDLLSLGDEEARALGTDTKRIRGFVIAASTLATSAVIASCGTIGWVGLVIPHLSRRIAGQSNKEALPATLLFGAGFMLLVDDVSRSLFTSEIPVGILTAFIGAPFFLVLMMRREVRHEH